MNRSGSAALFHVYNTVCKHMLVFARRYVQHTAYFDFLNLIIYFLLVLIKWHPIVSALLMSNWSNWTEKSRN